MSKVNRYSIQPENALIQFRINTPIGEVIARFQEFGGYFIAARPSKNSQTTSIDIRAGSLDADRKLICLMLRGEKFFDVEKFPSIRFSGSSFEWVDESNAVLIGDLTIKDVSRKVVFYVDVENSKNKTTKDYSLERTIINASANIRCSDYGLHRLTTVVSNTMSLNLTIEALKVDEVSVVAEPG